MRALEILERRVCLKIMMRPTQKELQRFTHTGRVKMEWLVGVLQLTSWLEPKWLEHPWIQKLAPSLRSSFAVPGYSFYFAQL